MPVWSDDDVRAAIDDGRIGAISLDTTAFDRAGCNLDAKILRSMAQFAGTGVSFLMTDITEGEVLKHLSAFAKESQEKARSALTTFQKLWRTGEDAKKAVESALDLGGDPADHARNWLEEYTSAVGCKKISAADLGDFDRLVQSYFGVKPPFASKKDKKAEFPDAIALITLEGWAKRNNKLVLVVSADKGWKEFSEHSDHVVWTEKLAQALDHFNAKDSFLAKRTIAYLHDGKARTLDASISAALEEYVINTDPMVEASSSHYYDVEYEGASWVSHRYPDPDAVTVLDSDDDTITLSIPMEVTAEFTASFIFMVKDEGEYIPIGSAPSLSKSLELEVELTVTVSRHRDDEEPDPVEVEVEEGRFRTLNFGHVEPNWEDEEW